MSSNTWLPLLIVVIVIIVSILEKKNQPPPQELTSEQQQAIKDQGWVIFILISLFLLVNGLNALLLKSLALEKAIEIQRAFSSFICFPVLILGLIIISISTIKYRVSAMRGRGQYYYPTGGPAVLWGILLLVAALILAFVFIKLSMSGSYI